MSDMYRRKRRGLRTAPPRLGVKGDEMVVATLTLISRLLRELEMMDWVGGLSLRFLSRSLYFSPLCHILSNAFSMSKNIARVISFLLVFLWISLERRRMLSVVARPCRETDLVYCDESHCFYVCAES